MDNFDLKNLQKRYFLWLYKNTKEALDKYERKFTQLDIDRDILLEVKNELLGTYMPHEKAALEKCVNDFEDYIEEKEKACMELRSQDKKVNPEFIFLEEKLEAIEKIILRELGRRALAEIKSLYEAEMIQRILKSTENK